MRAFSFSRSPAYLVQNPSSYFFRMIVPEDIRGVVGSREIRYSLRTGSLREAKYKARKMAGLVQTMFRVIPELKKRRNGYGMTVSRWFARYKERCGITTNGKQKDFHSFRHTFINTLKQTGEVEPVLISELVGRAVGSKWAGMGKGTTSRLCLKPLRS